MPKHTLLTREEALRTRDLIRERLGDRPVKIAAAVLTKGLQDGSFVGYASTFETEPDLAGDIVRPGAFTQSIRDWKARGTWPPLLWNHETDTPAAAIGVITDMKEDSRGLLVHGQLDLDHEPAEAIWRAMKSGRITTFSFAYAVLQEHTLTDSVNSLDVLDVLEVSVTGMPANRNARLVSVKTSNTTTSSNATVTWDDDIVALAREYDIEGAEEQLSKAAANGEDIRYLAKRASEIVSNRKRDPRNDPRRWIAALDELEEKAPGPTGPVSTPQADAYVEQLRDEKRENEELLALAEENSMRAALNAQHTREDELERDRVVREAEDAAIAQREADRQAEYETRERVDESRRAHARHDPHIFQE